MIDNRKKNATELARSVLCYYMAMDITEGALATMTDQKGLTRDVLVSIVHDEIVDAARENSLQK